jgi:hypothetical protein
MEHGRVVDRGPHLELVQRCAGYRDLITAYERDHEARDKEERDREERDKEERDGELQEVGI